MSVASEKISPTSARGFTAALLGWMFDGLDGYLYAMVAIPFVTSLMAGAPKDEVTQKASWIQGAFLVGWALGGAVFGRIGDRIGRSKTLTLTILTYALFTGMSFFAHEWWHLLIFRFVAALGIGGEWAAGSALVSETLHPKHRSWASATLQSGYMVGMIMAALTVGAIGDRDSGRYVFLIGVVPALLTLWIRYAVPEPDEWKNAVQKREMPKISELFAPGIVKTTLLVLTMTSICLTTIWVFLFFNAQVLKATPEVKALAPAEAAALLRNVTIVFCLWNIVGNYVATYLAKLIGYRMAFAGYLVAACACFLIGFSKPLDLGGAKLWFNLTMFFGTGVFAIFPLYIPPLFPTLLRTTGSGFCYNFGRLVAALGTVMGGFIASKVQPGTAIWYAGFIYIPGVAIALFMPETPYQERMAEGEVALATG